jgi:hypothetical protein
LRPNRSNQAFVRNMADKRGVSATSRNELTPELVGGLFRCQKTLDDFLQEPSTAVCFNDRQPGKYPTLVLRFDHFRCDGASFHVISGSTFEKRGNFSTWPRIWTHPIGRLMIRRLLLPFPCYGRNSNEWNNFSNPSAWHFDMNMIPFSSPCCTFAF